MRSTKTTKEKLIERINALKELPRTDNVQSILTRTVRSRRPFF